MGQIVVIILAIIIRIAVMAAKEDKLRKSSTDFDNPKLGPYRPRYELKDRENAIKEVERIEQETGTDLQEVKNEVSNESFFTTEATTETVSVAKEIDKLKLMVLMLIYVMYEDDGEFSRKEKRIVNTIIKASSKRFNANDAKQLQALTEIRPNIDYVFMKADDWGLTLDDVGNTVTELKRSFNKSPEYSSVFNRIENRITYEI